jgi:hypothetical protein
MLALNRINTDRELHQFVDLWTLLDNIGIG